MLRNKKAAAIGNEDFFFELCAVWIRKLRKGKNIQFRSHFTNIDHLCDNENNFIWSFYENLLSEKT